MSSQFKKMTNMKNIVYLSAASLFILISLTYLATTPIWPFNTEDRFSQCRNSKVTGGSGSIGGKLDLVSTDGRAVSEVEIFSQPSLVYFGYTFCPDVCPLHVSRNADAVDMLDERGIQTAPVFISVDPSRDTPEVLTEFAEMIHPRMLAYTGSEEQIRAASNAYKTYYKKQESNDEYYLVDHSTITYLVLPKFGFVEFFRADTSPEIMAETTACFVENS